TARRPSATRLPMAVTAGFGGDGAAHGLGLMATATSWDGARTGKASSGAETTQPASSRRTALCSGGGREDARVGLGDRPPASVKTATIIGVF
ncbi:MAG TPA: hypothetical protein VMK12_18425, partial [Anaeromyxobacteraceae bacterium]|nr:hypothetical protein [Anaeromyxobacteraceae bacterium]